MICKQCKKEYLNQNPKLPTNICSNKCYDEFQKWNKEPNCECPVCHKKFYVKPSRLKRVKHEPTCSVECSSMLKSQYMSGEGNHQFGLKGELNSSFKGIETIQHNHNVDDIMVYDPTHPYANANGRVKKHRLLVEQNYELFDNKFFLKEGGRIVLKKEYQVHHKDGNHNNNDINNLEVLTRSEHTSIHNKEKEIIRDTQTGRIIGVIKQGELLESPEVGNQQPSLDSNILEGSETSNRVLIEDSNVTTSALPANF